MATFIGVIDERLILGVRTRETPGIRDSNEIYKATLQAKEVPVEILQPFHWDDNIPVEEHGIRVASVYEGSTDFGSKDNRPRRYPLELSWRSPFRR